MSRLFIAFCLHACLSVSIVWGYEGDHNDGALLEEWERLVGEPRSIYEPLPGTGLEHWPSEERWEAGEEEPVLCFSVEMPDGSVLTMCEEE